MAQNTSSAVDQIFENAREIGKKKGKIDRVEAERRLMAYTYRVFDNPELSPILNKKKG